MKLFLFVYKQLRVMAAGFTDRHDVVTIKSVIITLHLDVSIAIMEEEIVDVDVRP